MPELPEVEVVRRGLADHALGRVIRDVAVLEPRSVRRHQAGPGDFVDRLVGTVFVAAHRRGKYLWLALDSGDALVMHLGMSGQVLIRTTPGPGQRHVRVRIVLAGTELHFVDQRMFGGLMVSRAGAVLPAEIRHIARDPLDPEFDEPATIRRIRRSRSGIKRLLLDQTAVSGIGNIYADEALWRAGLHGERRGDRLSVAQVRAVLDAAREVMIAALAQGGTSFDSLYVDVNGQSGYFARSLEAYGRQDEPCSRCGTPIRRVAFANRSSYFCPRCQSQPSRR